MATAILSPNQTETAAAGSKPLSPEARVLKWQIIGRITADHTELLERRREAAAKTEIELRIEEQCAVAGGQLPVDVRAILKRDVKDELLGFGPIQPFLDDDTVSEVMVNRADRIYV